MQSPALFQLATAKLSDCVYGNCSTASVEQLGNGFLARFADFGLGVQHEGDQHGQGRLVEGVIMIKSQRFRILRIQKTIESRLCDSGDSGKAPECLGSESI